MNIEQQNRFLILFALVNLDNSASKAQVLDFLIENDLISLDEDDLRILNSRNEEKWRNELAYVRSHLVNDGHLSNNSKGIWDMTEDGVQYYKKLSNIVAQSSSLSRIKINSLKEFSFRRKKKVISDDTIRRLWHFFLNEAKVYKIKNEVFSSIKERATYRIIDTANEVIIIKRLGRSNTTQTISSVKFRTMIKRLNQYGAYIPKGKIYDHVVEETTFVELLPFLDWSTDGKEIVVSEVDSLFVEKANLNPEAPNDDLDKRQLVARKVRQGQNKFRIKLLEAYDSKCAISGCSVIHVLQACHINPHSNSGINLSSNGLLLRSDLHDLFDLNLITINPIDLIIHVDNSLTGTEYYRFQGKRLASRTDNLSPDLEILNERWLTKTNLKC
ncbi:hypothetical protein D3C87_529190 [compost metagenome]